MRKMATIRRIDNISPIENADRIELLTIGGWKVVAQKGIHNVGDHVVYCEIDSWIPHDLEPSLSKGKEPREYEGVKGERLRSVKLRGQISQGLAIPVAAANISPGAVVEGNDVSELLGVLKWERPVPAQLAGVLKGNFPHFIPKTDQERVQNLGKELEFWHKNEIEWEITEKLDGSSMTVFMLDGEMNVCSRNLNLKETEGNSFWDAARQQNLESIFSVVSDRYAFQGELVGEGIQGNYYQMEGRKFFLYDIYDIEGACYVTPEHRKDILDLLNASLRENTFELPHVPILGTAKTMFSKIDYWLEQAEGQSMMVKRQREGIVMKALDGSASFKSINNKWLLKNE